MIPLCMLLKNLFFSTHEGIEPDLPQFECDVFINLRRVVDSWDGLTQKRKKTGSCLSLFNQRFIKKETNWIDGGPKSTRLPRK